MAKNNVKFQKCIIINNVADKYATEELKETYVLASGGRAVCVESSYSKRINTMIINITNQYMAFIIQSTPMLQRLLKLAEFRW
ncbi:hypothetical protein C9J12_27995 [Photobacterium frigidiphilum]|uniref:Uncharacterized protein n=1 Tax=Photobacterium frigidiphilum TaxID=264736 RepID=A0A2T3J6I7_9GAMM|nr:hypothetical protein [Photobacterium frigidiphilum]PSU43624.1 hypothetical protein C9J12_27995 [Photobacterium frigidiphilum]